MTDRELDIVLLGATGFVGSLTAGHLAEHAGGGVRIGLAGRSASRLARLRDDLGEAAADCPLIEVDASDAAGLRAMASRTRVVVTTVGPYARDGRLVVRACAEEGTHYADLTGEPLFVHWSVDTATARARQTGAKIVHSCGFDSVPSDLGVLLLADRADADGEGTLTDTTLVVRSLRGGISGGTLDSARQMAITWRKDPAARRLLADPHLLSPRRDEEPEGAQEKGSLLPAEREPGTGRWLGPFVMAAHNARVVRLSNTLTDWSYGRGLRYRELIDLGPGPRGVLRAGGLSAGMGVLFAGLAWKPTRTLLDRLLPAPGEGPDAERRATGRFRLDITTTTTTGARYRAVVAADHDPGYDGTAIMLGESALSLARDDLPERAGVLTPASAMGEALVDRLRAQGFTLTVERLG